MNLCLLTDSYKLTHWKQYPKGTETVYSYFEARGGDESTVFFGLQYILKKYLSHPVQFSDILEAEDLAATHFGNASLFNREGWRHLLHEHGGWLPIRIKAIPEGTVVPIGTPLISIENTCPKCFWLTNYLETLLVQAWYPTTVASISRKVKISINSYLEMTGDPAGIDFKLHDFGFRGVSSVESAGIGGAAHLVNFKGTDTIPALLVARDYYGEPCAGCAIPASEHSTVTSWGREHELDAFRNMLEQYPTGLVACVSDSYDIWKACEDLWGKDLKDKVLNRDGVLIVRPDSGVPKKIVLNVIEALGCAFGFSTNAKGYKVLNPKVRVIQGDGVNPEEIDNILWALKCNGWSADNVAFGMGGALLQQLHRDTYKMAFKCSALKANGVWQPVWKDPITDPGKKSKPGRHFVDPESYRTIPYLTDMGTLVDEQNALQTVYLNGSLTVDQRFAEIRARTAAAGLTQI